MRVGFATFCPNQTAKEAFGPEAQKSSIRQGTQKCRTMSKRNSIALTSKTSRITTLSHVSKERCASMAWALLTKPHWYQWTRSTSYLRKREKNILNEEIVSIVANKSTIKHNATNYEKTDTTKLKHRTALPTQLNHLNRNVTHVVKHTKPKNAGTEPTQQMIPEKGFTSSLYLQGRLANNRSPPSRSSQKT